MSNTYAFFQEKAPAVMGALIARFGLSVEEAAAIAGNTGHESGGYKQMQELRPVVAGSAGGLGIAQWTGPRRRAYTAFCAARSLDPRTVEGGIAFLLHELETTETRGLEAVRRPGSLEDKVKAFENAFERSGVKAYASRNKWARIALEAYSAGPVSVPVPPSPTAPAPSTEDKRRLWAEQRLAAYEITALQKRLAEMGLAQIVGAADGLWGWRTAAAVYALQWKNEGKIVLDTPVHADGHYGPQTKELLALGREASDQPAHKEINMQIKIPSPGAIAGVLGGLGSIAVALGYPDVASALSSLATPETVAQIIAVGGGLVTVLAGLLPTAKAA